VATPVEPSSGDFWGAFLLLRCFELRLTILGHLKLSQLKKMRARSSLFVTAFGQISQVSSGATVSALGRMVPV